MEAFTPPLLGFHRLVPCTYAKKRREEKRREESMAVARSWLTAAFLVFLLVAGLATAEDEVVQEEGYIGYGP
ncbi:unnamed protein product [Spirodela intermedia]|uniref:Uncharacterized protein n=1 Tax=Spirodela intermedia TaxID=51605 RepID=A0A7I8JR00_SPIIN|nr:unnamed protein product [Spirodela intermedia]CAA6672617.1 unnamed protein product [Spirodela intermedia]